ncbi:hypothetical protein [Streptomyces sp. NPDC051909]|uniref:hypothetical protein n=1 Tax=Streptomyces sp. NPDC051909 TaxID=3154944 RepID=UPI00343E4C6E
MTQDQLTIHPIITNSDGSVSWAHEQENHEGDQITFKATYHCSEAPAGSGRLIVGVVKKGVVQMGGTANLGGHCPTSHPTVVAYEDKASDPAVDTGAATILRTFPNSISKEYSWRSQFPGPETATIELTYVCRAEDVPNANL